MNKGIYTVLIIVFSAVFLLSAYSLADYFWESKKLQDQFEDLANLVSQAQQETLPPSVDAPIPSAPSAPDSTETVPPVTLPPMVEVEDPKTGETIWILREYAPVYLMNTDLVGWMQIAGTKINYPVMQTPDRENYYLHRNFNREDSAHGCLYVREVCDVNTPSDNLTIYGHRMKDGTMFAPLHKYQDKSFWEKHPTIQFDTLTEHHTYEIFSVFLTTASVGQGFEYHRFVDASDAAHFDDFVATCKRLALYDTGVDAQYGDKLITLSTCEYSQTNGRLVVVAKRIN